MNKVEVELYTDQGNNAVLQLPNRNYPGVVVQGDSLLNLTRAAESLLNRAKSFDDEDLTDEAEEVYFGLNDILDELKRVARESKLDIPYLK